MSDERRIMDDEVVVGLRKARALIERRRHWARGYTYRPSGQLGGRLGGEVARCAVMAALDADSDQYCAIIQRLAKALPADYPASMDSVIFYNDTHTHAEVLALFDRAIAMRLGELGCQSAATTK